MQKDEKNSLYIFIFLAYGLSWLLWLISFLLGYRDLGFMEVINREFSGGRELTAFIFFRLGIYGPLAASLIASYHFFHREGLKRLWEKTVKWKIGLQWYIYLLIIPVFISFVVVLVGLIMGVPLNDFFSGGIPFSLIIPFFIYQVFTSGLEEPGWRGFALERLQKKFNAEKTSWILGLIWAIWHFPYVIFLYSGTGFFPIVFSLVGFTMAIIGQTFIFTWFYNNTGSVLIAILFHATLNTSTTFIIGDITIKNPAMGIIPALVTWGIVLFLLKRYGGEKLLKN